MKNKTAPLFSFVTIFGGFAIACCYIALTIVIINYRFVHATIVGTATIGLKLTIFLQLFLGMFSAFGILAGWLLGINALLVGLNSMILIKTIQLLRAGGKLKLSLGGLTFLSLISTGCSACGISFLATLGLGSAFSFFPFFTTLLSVITMLLLLFSLSYMIYKLLATKVCKL